MMGTAVMKNHDSRREPDFSWSLLRRGTFWARKFLGRGNFWDGNFLKRAIFLEELLPSKRKFLPKELSYRQVRARSVPVESNVNFITSYLGGAVFGGVFCAWGAT